MTKKNLLTYNWDERTFFLGDTANEMEKGEIQKGGREGMGTRFNAANQARGGQPPNVAMWGNLGKIKENDRKRLRGGGDRGNINPSPE